MSDQDLFKEAVAAIQAGDSQTGGRLLAKILKQEPQNELAWLWFAQCQSDAIRKKRCLEQVLSINPGNLQAQEALDELDRLARVNWLQTLSPRQKAAILTGLLLLLGMLSAAVVILYFQVRPPTTTAIAGSAVIPTAPPITPQATMTLTAPAPPTSTITATTTATSTPTEIPDTPTATHTAEPSRPGPLVSASYFASPPTIDGTWIEWPKGEYPVPYLILGESNWSGPEDLSASYKIGWDEEHLYIAVKVRDDHYIQNTNGPMIYKGDSMELLLDRNLKGDFDDRKLSEDDYRIGISPGNGAINGSREAYLWFPKSKEGHVDARITAMTDAPGTYRLEFALAWRIFGIVPEKGARYGFGFSVSDNDDFRQNVQDSLISSLQNRQVADPTTWGVLVLN